MSKREEECKHYSREEINEPVAGMLPPYPPVTYCKDCGKKIDVMAEKYLLTEKKVELREPSYKRWQYTLSGWIRLIRTDSSDEGQEMERQILARMWEDYEFNKKIRAEFEAWLAEEPEEPYEPEVEEAAGIIQNQDWTTWEADEDEIRTRHNKSIRNQGKYKGRGKEKKRE